MTARFRLIAGPNGSGKTTLTRMLAEDYAVNLYTMLNADDFFAAAKRTKAIPLSLEVEPRELKAFAARSEYGDDIKSLFINDIVAVKDGFIRFANEASVNSYSVALVTNFLQEEYIKAGRSFSQETVFSHPSKVAALEKARAAGMRTYLYFVATENAKINAKRVAARYAQGGHNVPTEKIVDRYFRSLSNVRAALPFCSRAFFFDNSASEMRHIASYSAEDRMKTTTDALPEWFKRLSYAGNEYAI